MTQFPVFWKKKGEIASINSEMPDRSDIIQETYESPTAGCFVAFDWLYFCHRIP
ncbi:MAG: hypothetical protein H8E10_04845 [Desulfobacterales bacterium]|nr:hypothetical protein [Desulfobacterales bacterium]